MDSGLTMAKSNVVYLYHEILLRVLKIALLIPKAIWMNLKGIILRGKK